MKFLKTTSKDLFYIGISYTHFKYYRMIEIKYSIVTFYLFTAKKDISRKKYILT